MKKIYILFLVLMVSSTIFCQVDWQKHETIVLERGESGSWESDGLIMPSVILVDNVYHMWYGGMSITGVQIGHATSNDGINWTKDALNPVLTKGESGSWDWKLVYMPVVIYEGSTFHMWYVGADANVEKIGYATSPDGTVWTKYENNPVFSGSAGNWDGGHVGPGSVHLDGETFRLWYGASNTLNITGMQIGYATSPDGINWTRYEGNPIMQYGAAGSWDNPRVQPGTVIKDDEGYKMWYSGGKFMNWEIGYATSPDGLNWTKDSLNPVLKKGTAGSFDDTNVSFPNVLFDETHSKYKMWYSAADEPYHGDIGYAEAWVTGVPQNIIYKTGFTVFPNPASNNTTISFNLQEKTNVRLSIFNLLGQEEMILLNEEMFPGEQEVSFNISELKQGMYLVKLLTDRNTSAKLIVKE